MLLATGKGYEKETTDAVLLINGNKDEKMLKVLSRSTQVTWMSTK